MSRHLDAEGGPLVDDARPGAVYLLELARGPSADTSPGVAAEISVLPEGVELVHWLLGEPFRVVRIAGKA
jgi:hypothetical protein